MNGSTTPVGNGTYTVNPPYPGPAGCTDEVGNVPLFNTNGTPTTVTVTETPGATYSVQSITVNPGTPIAGSPDLSNSTITFNPALGPDIVKFTNSVPALLCFTGQTDDPNGPYGGFCEVNPGGQSADLDTLNCPAKYLACYAGVYQSVEAITGESIGAVNNLGFTWTGGPIGGGSPRFSIPLDRNGDGFQDVGAFPVYAFAEAATCNDGLGHVDVIHNPNCLISFNDTGLQYPNWAAFVAAEPGDKIAGDALTFIVADQPFLGTISNVSFGP